MKQSEWIRLIKRQTKKINTYETSFDPVIETLASILEKRDEALKSFEESGGDVVVEFTSDRGAVNHKKNPRLQVWQELNTQALAYWKDLGLTPAGLKKINDITANKKEEGSKLEKALNEISKELGKSP